MAAAAAKLAAPMAPVGALIVVFRAQTQAGHLDQL
jgi:hypothetical protein